MKIKIVIIKMPALSLKTEVSEMLVKIAGKKSVKRFVGQITTQMRRD